MMNGTFYSKYINHQGGTTYWYRQFPSNDVRIDMRGDASSYVILSAPGTTVVSTINIISGSPTLGIDTIINVTDSFVWTADSATMRRVFVGVWKFH